jgi:hypothetical protein
MGSAQLVELQLVLRLVTATTLAAQAKDLAGKLACTDSLMDLDRGTYGIRSNPSADGALAA